MKEFHRNYVYRPTETEKKVRRAKNQHKEACKCYAPFVKLHYYDCPAVKKSCPLHGHSHYHERRDDKGEPEQNMIISFHPSSKTERLFQPVKTLLAQCNPETKVNLQYYSPKSTTSKESIKHEQLQTKSDDKKSLNNNVFVEKTKSFVADKTNKMKKLKQCFYSPCNSIAQKSRSQTSIKEKFHEIFQEERKKASDFGKMAPDKPPDDIKYDPMWFSNKFDFKDWEKLSGGKTDSDFITVTQQAKNNLINHKIFEIKHKKGLNDLPFVRLPKQSTQLVYSSIDVDRPLKETTEFADPDDRKRLLRKEQSPEDSREIDSKQKRDEELSSEENSHTSSSSSVYFTPFIFVPATADSDTEGKPKPLGWADEAVQVGEPYEAKKGAQGTQTPSLLSEQELISHSHVSNTRSVLQQTDLDRQSGDSGTQGWYLRHVEVAESFTTRGTQTDEGLYPSEKNMGDSRGLVEFSSEDFTLSSNGSNGYCKNDKQTCTSSVGPMVVRDVESRGVTTVEVVKTVEVQTGSYRWNGSVLNTARWAISRIDKVCQTEPLKVQEVSRLWSLKINKSQVATPKLSNKTTQTIFSRSESMEEVSEFIGLDSSNVTYVVKPFGHQESDQAIDKLAKAWWGKSHSDSELYDNKKCGCWKLDCTIPLPQVCQCRASEATRQSVTPGKQNRKSTVSNVADGAEKSSSKGNKSSRGESKAEKSPETPRKVDKGLGTDDGAQRLYRRADKALGTDSGEQMTPKTSIRATRFGGTPVESSVTDRSPRTPEYSLKSERIPGKEKTPDKSEPSFNRERTPGKEDSPRTPLSDLSELTKIIQEFFEKTGMTSWRNCTCDVPTLSEKKVEFGKANADPRRPKNELPDATPGSNERKVDSETMTEMPKKPKGDFANAEIQPTVKGPPPTDSRLSNKVCSDRVKIRRSVLLDDNQSKTRFICSVCAREISTFSMNAATNTENLLNSRKKEKSTVSTEISELVKVKAVRTVRSSDTPNRIVLSAPEQSTKMYTSGVCEELHPGGTKSLRESPRSSFKSGIPTPKGAVGGVCYTDRTSRETQSSQPTKPDSVKQTPTTSFQRPPLIKRCFCNDTDKICTSDTCPNKEAIPSTSTNSKAVSGPPPKTDLQPSLPRTNHPGVPNSQSRTSGRSVERSRSQRRNYEQYYPVFIKSLWPRELAWNVSEKSESNILNNLKSSTSQQKRSYEKDMEPVDSPAGKKVKAELEKPSRQCFMFGDPASSDLRLGDRTLFANKGGLFWIPSFSASHVSPPKKHTLSPSKTIRSEEKVREGNQRNRTVSPEEFNVDAPPDLFSAKSCHLAPIALGCDSKQPFDKLFECRVCKSLTFMKNDKDEVVFHWPHGLLAYRPETPTDQNPTARRVRREEASEPLQRKESSTQNLEKLLEECSRFSERSDSPSTEELLEEVEEMTEEEPEVGSQSRDAPPSLDDLFYSNAAVSSKSFNTFWFDGYAKKK